jgi:NAD(P)-dependent dehydrogenase (short-subunit alcohol dehydrogenase family)
MAFTDFSDTRLSELVDLSGRVAVVTGGTRGIGHAIAARLAEGGAMVYVTGRSGDRAAEAADALAERGLKVRGARVDVSRADEVEALAQTVVRDDGRIDIWVNNAGVYPPASALETTDEMWRHIMGTNLDGTFHGARAAGRAMRDQGSGVIVNITSTASFRAEASVSYVASKHAVVGLTKVFANELGRHGIRVVAVAPGVTTTAGLAQWAEDMQKLPEAVESSPDPTLAPAGRAAVPDDIARAVYMVATNLATFVTGSVILVEGGRLAV